MQNVVPRFVGDPGKVATAGGAIGQDNAEVYGRWLGLTAAEIEQLAASKVI